MELNNDEILLKYPVKLRRNMRELLIEQIGITSMTPKICMNPKKLRYDSDVLKANSFTIEIPYAGKHLIWEVIFNDENLSLAPDFIFCNDFLMDPDFEVVNNALPSWSKWDIDNPKSLITLIKELLQLYLKFQLLRLKENNLLRPCTEYLKLIKDEIVSENDMEVYIDNDDTVHLLIALKLDFSNLPPYLQAEYLNNNTFLNPCADTTTLRVCFLPNKTFTTLILSPRVQQLIGPSSQLHIPPINREAGLVKYVPIVTKLLKDKINYISKQYKFRKDYISQILGYQELSIVEYDSVEFSMITFLIESDNAYALVTIHITKAFPAERPLVRLSSITYQADGKPMMEMQHYPFDCKSSMDEMVKILLKHLIQAIPAFKLNCLNSTNKS